MKHPELAKAFNQNGQMTIEMILLATLLFAGTVAISNYFQSNNILGSIVEGPWSYVRGMIESGVWAPADQAAKQHPNLLERRSTRKGEVVQ